MAENFLGKDTVHELARIAAQAGQAIMEIYESAERPAVSSKSDNSPLTRADLCANEIIVSALKKLSPGISVLSEESLWPGGGVATYWAVDPLDGTKEFIKRNGEFTVNIALVIDGVARLGVICAPALKTLWAGIVGSRPQDSWAGRLIAESLKLESVSELLWTDISVTPPAVDAQDCGLRLLSSRSHRDNDLPGWLLRILGDAVRIEKGSSLKFCLIAQGDADIYVRMGPTSIWDTAAGHAILRASGGSIVEIETTTELIYKNPHAVLNPKFIAYVPHRFKALESKGY